MSKRFLGNIITKTPVEPSGPYQDDSAKGVWSLEEANAYKAAGLWPTAGNENPDIYVENNFSTYLFTGTGAAQTINNGIDLSNDGGMVWLKHRARSSGDFYSNHFLFDTERGASTTSYISSNNSSAQGYMGAVAPAIVFNNNGFTTPGVINSNTETAVSWTFRKAPNFFDVVTYTGNGTAGRTVSHSLGSVPGMIILKNISSGSEGWRVYHRGANGGTNPEQYYAMLQSQNAFAAASTPWNNTAPTSTEFTLGTDTGSNNNGDSFVAYLFGHDTSSDGMIQCGNYTGNGSTTGPVVDLGFEPQWLFIKNATSSDNWVILDNMRGNPVGASDARLFPNLSNAEDSFEILDPTASGFNLTTDATTYNANSSNYIYMAIRRGPMKTPTASSQVFGIAAATTTAPLYKTGILTDMAFYRDANSAADFYLASRLTEGQFLRTNTNAVAQADNSAVFDYQTGFYNGSYNAATTYAWSWKRAPGFFDVVTYTGNDTARTINHNLGVAPEMMWIKSRNPVGYDWVVYYGDETDYLKLNTTDATADGAFAWNDTAPTSSVFSLGIGSIVNEVSRKFIAYLFATVAGVSKVGSVTHSGTTNVDCGFSSGSKLIILKRTDATGDWYVWDSVRGIVAGDDPYLLLNTNAAQVTNTDYVDPLSSGFTITDDFTDGTYIFYAVAA